MHHDFHPDIYSQILQFILCMGIGACAAMLVTAMYEEVTKSDDK